jgi:hypothetical protein
VTSTGRTLPVFFSAGLTLRPFRDDRSQPGGERLVSQSTHSIGLVFLDGGIVSLRKSENQRQKAVMCHFSSHEPQGSMVVVNNQGFGIKKMKLFGIVT